MNRNQKKWWEATVQALQETLCNLREKGKDSSSIQALSCDSTSGTVLALDREGRTLSRAIMLMMEERTKKQKS